MANKRQGKQRTGVCGVCGGGIFQLPVSMPRLGKRAWWHEDYGQDYKHEAVLAGKGAGVASGVEA